MPIYTPLSSMSCSGINIFGDDTCESGGLTPSQEADLISVVDKTINISSAVQLPTPITTITGAVNCDIVNTPEININGCSITNPFGPDLVINNGTGYISLSGELIRAHGEIVCVGESGTGIILNEQAITTAKTTFNDDQELVSKKFVEDSINLQNAYDRGPDILTKAGTPLTITGPAGIETDSDIKVYGTNGANQYATFVSHGNIILKTDNPAQTDFGSINYLTTGSSRSLNLQVDKGNSGGASSTTNIQVDGQTFSFKIDHLDMNAKKIRELAEPTLPQDAATKNFVEALQPNQTLNTTNNVLFNKVGVATDVTVGVVGIDTTKLTPTLLEFKGDSAFTSYGRITYADGNTKTFTMSVNKGNSPNASIARVEVDGSLFLFTPTAFDVNNKRIRNLAEPVISDDAATKNYVDTAIASVGLREKVSFDNGIDWITTVNPIWTDGVITIGWDAPADITQIMVNNQPSVGNITYFSRDPNVSGSINTWGVPVPIGSGIVIRDVQRIWLNPSSPASGILNYKISICNTINAAPNAHLTVERW